VDIQKQGAPGAAGKSPPAGGAQFSDELSAAGVAAALGSVGLLNDVLRPKQEINVIARDPARPNEKPKVFKAVCRIDTPVEVDYYRNGGILPTVLRKLAKR
jgi:aconitase A